MDDAVIGFIHFGMDDVEACLAEFPSADFTLTSPPATLVHERAAVSVFSSPSDLREAWVNVMRTLESSLDWRSVADVVMADLELAHGQSPIMSYMDLSRPETLERRMKLVYTVLLSHGLAPCRAAQLAVAGVPGRSPTGVALPLMRHALPLGRVESILARNGLSLAVETLQADTALECLLHRERAHVSGTPDFRARYDPKVGPSASAYYSLFAAAGWDIGISDSFRPPIGSSGEEVAGLYHSMTIHCPELGKVPVLMFASRFGLSVHDDLFVGIASMLQAPDSVHWMAGLGSECLVILASHPRTLQIGSEVVTIIGQVLVNGVLRPLPLSTKLPTFADLVVSASLAPHNGFAGLTDDDASAHLAFMRLASAADEAEHSPHSPYLDLDGSLNFA